MKGLSVNAFWSIKPKLPFRFKAHFYTGIEKLNNLLNISLTTITLPKMEGKASEGSMYLGNTIFTVPTWSIGTRKLEITFEETDYMIISQFIDLLNSKSWGKSSYRITIAIEEFDDKMRYSNSKGYICHLSNYTEPQFKRDGQAGQVTMYATFIIDSIIDDWDESKVVVGNTVAIQNTLYNKKAIFGEQERTYKQINVNPKANYKAKNGAIVSDEAGGHNKAGSKNDNGYKGVNRDLLNKSNTKTDEYEGKEENIIKNMEALGMDKKEIDRQLAQLNSDKYKGDQNTYQLKNLEALTTRLIGVKEMLAAKGITMNYSCFLTGEHVDGDLSATHGMGSKADINFFKDGKKIEYNNATVEDINEIQAILNANGLYMQFEGNPYYGDETGWGDVVLNDFINSKGKLLNDKEGRDQRKNSWGEYFKYKDDTDHTKKK